MIVAALHDRRPSCKQAFAYVFILLSTLNFTFLELQIRSRSFPCNWLLDIENKC